MTTSRLLRERMKQKDTRKQDCKMKWDVVKKH